MPDGVVLTYAYNAIGQIESITSNHGDIVDAMAYSPLSQVKTIDYANDVISTMTYDPAQMYRMSDKLTEDDTHTTQFQEVDYTYDNVGNITDLVESSGSSANKTAAYVYDDLYRLTSATITNTTSGSNYTQTFTFDSIGNILTKSDQGTYTYAENSKTNPHAVTLIDNGSGTTKTYTYDDNGNMTQEVFANGTITITKGITWDHLNRMIETEVDDGTDMITVTYTYDQGGRRLKKAVDDGTTTETTRYPFADFEVTATNSTKTTVNADTQHVATIEDDGTSQIIYFHHDDHLGGANIVTSVVGALVQVIDYYPFGSVRIDDQSSTYDSTQKFTGHELDDATGLYYAKARYYDSEIGRFISQDALQSRVGELMAKFSAIPQGLNYYSYSLNEPIVLKDPVGDYPVTSQVTDASTIGKLYSLSGNNYSPQEKLGIFAHEFRATAESKYLSKGEEQNRYVYTKQAGWLDLKHVASAANNSFGAGIVGYNSIQYLGSLVEKWQDYRSNPSAYSFEDLNSNVIGAYFGAFYLPKWMKEHDGDLDFGAALESYLEGLGSVSTQEAIEKYGNVGDWEMPDKITEESEKNHPKSKEATIDKNSLDKTFK